MGQPGEHRKWQGLLPGLCHRRAAEARVMGVVETALNRVVGALSLREYSKPEEIVEFSLVVLYVPGNCNPTCPSLLTNMSAEAGEMAQGLKMLDTLSKNLHLVPSTRGSLVTITSDSGSMAFARRKQGSAV